MQVLRADARDGEYRQALMQFLNRFGLDAAAILVLSRVCEPVRYGPGEAVLHQGTFDTYVYFLIEGNLRVLLNVEGEVRVLGERQPVTLLGEISYFNNTPATATVEPAEEGPVVLLRVSYPVFTDIIREHPGVKTVFARIGDLRVISGYNGFMAYRFFMDQIGRKHDRFAVNRALFPALERTVRTVLLPALNEHHRILDVGDGPGIVCELLNELRPDLGPRLFIQANQLEDAITQPFTAQSSDLTRARYLREQFHYVIALQVFNVLPPDRVEEQFKLVRSLLLPGGHLLLVKLNLLNLHYSSGSADTRLLHQDLEDLLERTWPGMSEWRPLIHVSFQDADFDAAMEWNPSFCKAASHLRVPDRLPHADRVMLNIVLEQARSNVFNPDEAHFHWLNWIAGEQGFEMVSMAQEPELSFYYQLLRLK
jgi:CRP-like cAMP-binding protein